MLAIDPEKEDASREVTPGRPPKLTSEHIGYLTSSHTLQKWACKTLQERVILFHRHFPEIKISPRTLCSLYKKNKISKKALRYVKMKKYEDPQKRNLFITKMREQL